MQVNWLIFDVYADETLALLSADWLLSPPSTVMILNEINELD